MRPDGTVLAATSRVGGRERLDKQINEGEL
jgi:hypothetical protein